MRRLVSYLALVLVLGGCGACRCNCGVTTERTVETVDSVAFRPEEVEISIPEESEEENVPVGDTTRVETSFAEASAWVEDGRIHQRIRNRSEQLRRIKIDVPVHIHSQKEYLTGTVIKEVEKPIGWFRKTLMYAGAVALICALVALAAAVIRRWNKIKQLFKPF